MLSKWDTGVGAVRFKEYTCFSNKKKIETLWPKPSVDNLIEEEGWKQKGYAWYFTPCVNNRLLELLLLNSSNTEIHFKLIQAMGFIINSLNY